MDSILNLETQLHKSITHRTGQKPKHPTVPKTTIHLTYSQAIKPKSTHESRLEKGISITRMPKKRKKGINIVSS